MPLLAGINLSLPALLVGVGPGLLPLLTSIHLSLPILLVGVGLSLILLQLFGIGLCLVRLAVCRSGD